MLHKRLRFLLLLFFSVSTFHSYSQQPVHLTRYTVKDGLTNNAINCIRQDANGFLWIATNEGLSRYDGESFENFLSDPQHPLSSLPGYTVRNLESYKQFIFIGTNNGMAVYNVQSGRFENNRIRFDECAAGSRHLINNIRHAGNGDVFLNIDGKPFLLDSALHLKIDFVKKYNLDHDVLFAFTEFLMLNDSSVLLESSRGLFYFNSRSLQFCKTIVSNAIIAADTGLYNCTGIIRYNANSFLMGTYNRPPARIIFNKQQPYRLTIIDTLKLPFRYASVAQFVRSRYNGLVAATAQHGILKINERDTTQLAVSIYVVAKDSVISNECADIYEDNEANLWIATSEGLYRLPATDKRFTLLKPVSGEALINPQPYSLSLSKNHKVIAACQEQVGNKLLMFDLSSKNILLDSIPNKIKTNGFIDISELDDSTTYLATWYGGYIAELSSKKISIPWFIPDSLKEMLSVCGFVDSRKNIWVGFGAGKGLIHVWTKEHRVDYYNHYIYPPAHANYLPIRYPTSIAEAKNGTIWFGVIRSEGKLAYYDYKTNAFKAATASNIKSGYQPYNGMISGLATDSANNLWLASLGNGLIKFDVAHNTYTQFTRHDGISSNYLYDLAMDKKQDIWINTSDGLSCFNIATATFRNFSVDDGLFENELEGTLCFDSNSNTMYASGKTKLFYFNPDSLYENTTAPRPFITYVRVNDSIINPVANNAFSYQMNTFEFQFTAVNLTDGKGNRYEYMLQGLENNWKNGAQHKQINYSNLMPGSYTFMVKAANKYGVWSILPASFSFTINPPWWQTWWFRILAALLVACIVYVVFYIRIQRIKAFEAMRSRISRDLHDDVGSTLSSINILSNSAKRLTHIDAARTKEFLENINDSAQRMLINMNDIIWAIKPAEDTLEQLMQRMQYYAADILEANNISYVIDFPESLYNIKLTLDQKRNIFLVFKEAVNNLAKYSQCTEASIIFNRYDRLLTLIISDNGKGFSKDDLQNAGRRVMYNGGNGLANMHKRAIEIKGELKITSQPGNGTQVKLEIRK